MTETVDAIVIGGGILGLAAARALGSDRRNVLVLERRRKLASETSARNSEVIHAGIYYQPGSLKARACVEGKALLYQFCSDHNVPTLRCGKLIVAQTDAETAALHSLISQAKECGVADLALITKQDAATLEPEVACQAACLSPSTGVIDSHALVQALEAEVLNQGGTIVLNTTACRLKRYGNGIEVETQDQDGRPHPLRAHTVINAAGLCASTVSGTMSFEDAYLPPKTYFAKAHYYDYSGTVPFSHLIYPMPSLHALGIHFTRGVGGDNRFGPDISWSPTLNYEFEDSDGQRKQQFVDAITRYWPAVDTEKLNPGMTGFRPKLSAHGEPTADFAIHSARDHGVTGYIALYGIESPGLTSCLSLAATVAQLANSTRA